MKFMPLRVFLRGGYQHVEGPVVVTRNGYPYLTVLPGLVTRTDDRIQASASVVSSSEPKIATTSRG